MIPLLIDVSKQLDGYNLGLSPIVKKQISERFGQAKPVSHIFISQTGDFDFEANQNRLIRHILPIITGVEVADLCQTYDSVIFWNTFDDKKSYEIPLKYVQKAEPVFG
jgi:hypothetical protein